jgi:hypothetical protein
MKQLHGSRYCCSSCASSGNYNSKGSSDMTRFASRARILPAALVTLSLLVSSASADAGHHRHRHHHHHNGGIPTYRVFDIGLSDPRPAVVAQSLNDRGDVAGSLYNDEFFPRAFLYKHSSGRVIDLGTLGPGISLEESEASALNNRGEVVGLSTIPGLAEWHAVRWDRSGIHRLEGLHFVHDVDDAGTAVGMSESDRPVFWKNGRIADLGIPGYASAVAISTTNEYIAAWSQSPPHAFLYKDGEAEDIGVLDPVADFSTATDVNRHGEVVGYSSVRYDDPFFGCCDDVSRGFFYSHGEMVSIGSLDDEPGLSSYAYAINDDHEVVGLAIKRTTPPGVPVDGVVRAVLYKDGELMDLTDLIDARDPLRGSVRLDNATDINCHGWILVNGFDLPTSTYRAYLLIPTDKHSKRRSCGRD